MLPTSVTSSALTLTQAVLEKITRVHCKVVNVTTRWHTKTYTATLLVHNKVERVHQDAVEREYRAQYTRDQEILAVVDKSRTVKSLRDQVLALREHVVSLSFVCVVLAVGNFVQLLYFISR